MKFNVCLTLLFAAVLSITSCKKESGKDSERDFLTEEEVATLDGLPEATGFAPETIILPNGRILKDYLQEIDSAFGSAWFKTTDNAVYEQLGPQDARNLLIARLTLVAWNYADRTRHQKIEEGPGKPAQNGFAYSWGAKDTIRQVPPGGGTVCNEAISGLDCSGFIHQLFKHSGVSFITGPANQQRQPQTLQNAIKSAIPALKKVKVEDLGQLPASKFENGDIIYWLDGSSAFHIGIVLKKSGGGLAVFQSNGSKGTSAADCEKNKGLTRGVRSFELNDPYWFGSSKAWGITRINAEISGKWKFKIRCQGAGFDFITYDLDFPTQNSESFTITKTQVYPSDNRTYNVTFNFSYDNTTNVLSCHFVTTSPNSPGFYRNDYISEKLTRDLIPYFSATLGDNKDAGCSYQIQLENIDK